MKKNTYKSIDQLIDAADARIPLSTRVQKNTKSFLFREAKSRKLTVSNLSAAILDDYAKTFSRKAKDAKV